MVMTKILDIENDGLNMAIDGSFLYIRCKRIMYKHHLTDMRIAAHNVVFKKDGKARSFSVCDHYLFLTDFCDLYLLRKDDLQVIEVIRLGADASSDLGCVRFDAQKAYIGIRNGKMAVMDIRTRDTHKFDIIDSSFWDFCVVGNRIIAGTVRGELIEIDTRDVRVLRKVELCKKNIYSVVPSGGLLYTVSQDMTIKAVSADTFETVCVAKKAVAGMAKILGVLDDRLIIADTNQLSMWDRHTLQFYERFDFPTGAFNKGALLCGNRLYGSDFQGIYSCTL